MLNNIRLLPPFKFTEYEYKENDSLSIFNLEFNGENMQYRAKKSNDLTELRQTCLQIIVVHKLAEIDRKILQYINSCVKKKRNKGKIDIYFEEIANSIYKEATKQNKDYIFNRILTIHEMSILLENEKKIHIIDNMKLAMEGDFVRITYNKDMLNLIYP